MFERSVAEDQDALIAQAVEEYFCELDRGEAPALEDFVTRYPKVGDILRNVLPALKIADGWSTDAPPPTAQGMARLGDFRIVRQLGRGGMGIVYETEELSLRRRVALKVLPLASLISESSLRRFRNEVRAAATLEHPHIVPVYSVGEENGIHYYAMQLIRGRNLAQVIASLRSERGFSSDLNRNQVDETTWVHAVDGAKKADASQDTTNQAADSTLSQLKRSEYFRSVAKLTIDAAGALQHAHSQGIVHRDIKPANLLLDPTGKVYVTDFGLARIEADAGLTLSGDVIGTLRYMSPEQAIPGDQMVDHLTDVYSLGTTLYELLALTPAYSSGDRQQLLKLISFEEPAALTKIDREIPGELDLIARKAMAKEKSERYQSAQELADDLQRFLEHRPILAKRPTVAQVLNKWTRRNPVPTWATIFSLSVLVLASSITALLVSSQRDKAVAAQQLLADELYAKDVAAAYDAWSGGNPRRTRELLASWLPREGQEDRRGVEWFLLASFCKSNQGDLLIKKDENSDWAVSPDGRLVATFVDGNLITLDVVSRERRTIASSAKGPLDWIQGIEFTPDGRRVAYGGPGGVQIIDLANRDRVTLFPGEPQRQIAFSPDGVWGASISHSGTVLMWRVETGEVAWSKPRYRATSRTDSEHMIMEFSPDSHEMVTVSGDYVEAGNPDVVVLWRVENGELTEIPIHEMTHQHFHLDGQFIDRDSFLLSSPDGIDHFNLRDRREEETEAFEIPRTRVVASFAISSDAKQMALGTEDNKLEIWDLKTGKLVDRRFRDSRVSRVHFLDESRLLLSSNHYIEVCDLAVAGSTRLPTDLRPEPPRPLTIHGDKVAFRGKDPWEIEILDVGTETFRTVRFAKETQIRAFTYSPDGSTFAVLDTNGGLWTCDAGTGEIIKVYPSQRPVSEMDCGVEFSPDGELLATGKHGLECWRVDDPKTYWSQSDPVPECYSLKFSPDGQWLCTAGEARDFRGFVSLWQVDGGVLKLIKRFRHDDNVWPIAFSPDGRWLATGDQSKKVVVYNLQTLQREVELTDFVWQPWTIAFSPDSRTLIASEAVSPGETYMWQVPTWRPVGTLDKTVGHLRFVNTPSRGWGLVGRFDKFTDDFQIQWLDFERQIDWSWLDDRSRFSKD